MNPNEENIPNSNLDPQNEQPPQPMVNQTNLNSDPQVIQPNEQIEASLNNDQPPALNTQPVMENQTPINPIAVNPQGMDQGVSMNNNPNINQTSTLFSPDPVMNSGNSSRPKARFRVWFILGAVLALILIGLAVFWFGFWNNPNYIWSQGISDENTAYKQIISYLNSFKQNSFKSYKVSGNLKLNFGSTNYAGNISGEIANGNSQFNLNANLGVANLGLNEVSINNPGTYPDIYLKASGLSGLGSLLGSSSGLGSLSALDNQWIKIDSNTLNSLQSSTNLNLSTLTVSSFSYQGLINLLSNFESLNQEYLFNSGSTGVLVREKNLGSQIVSGNNTYEYEVGINSANLKAYLGKLIYTINSSSLSKELSSSGISASELSSVYGSLINSLNNKDNIYVWVNTSTRLIYMIRISSKNNPSEYLQFGLNYQNNSKNLPFFVQINTASTGQNYLVNLGLNINTSTNQASLSISLSSSSFKASLNLNVLPGNQNYTITAPSPAIPLQSVLAGTGFTPSVLP